jgi:hypothetical protein
MKIKYAPKKNTKLALLRHRIHFVLLKWRENRIEKNRIIQSNIAEADKEKNKIYRQTFKIGLKIDNVILIQYQ